MRITPNRLKEIIREELINEAVPSYKPKSPSVDIGSGDSAVSNFHTSAVDGMADKAWQDHWIPAKPIVKIARGLGVIDHVDLSDKKQIRETAQVLQHIQKEGFKRIKEGSLDWEKNFKWAKTDELKVIQFLIGMSHGGISDVIKDMKKNPSAFKSFVKDLAKQGLYEGFGGALKKEDRKKFDDMRRRQAEVLGYTLTGKDDVKTEIGDATVKEGKLNEEKYVVASIYGDLYTPKAVSRSKADKLMMKLANQYAGDNVFVLGAKYWNKPHKYNKKKIMVKEGLDLKKLETAIQDFQNKIKKQGSVTNARDEEHLKQLIKVYKEMGGKKIKEGKLNEGKWAVINANDVLNIFAEKVVDTQKEAEEIAKQMKQKDKYGKYQAVSVKRWNQSKPGNKIKEGKLTEGKTFKYKKNDWKKYNKLAKKKEVMVQTAFGDLFAWEEGSNYGIFATDEDGREIELDHDDIDSVEIF